jgi:hypothetical protein
MANNNQQAQAEGAQPGSFSRVLEKLQNRYSTSEIDELLDDHRVQDTIQRGLSVVSQVLSVVFHYPSTNQSKIARDVHINSFD